jgi:hypothetical protein
MKERRGLKFPQITLRGRDLIRRKSAALRQVLHHVAITLGELKVEIHRGQVVWFLLPSKYRSINIITSSTVTPFAILP